MFNISFNFKDAKKVDHILEISLEVQSIFDSPNVIYQLSKIKDDIQVLSLNSHVYWDTLYGFSAGISSLVIPNPTVHLLTDLSNIEDRETRVIIQGYRNHSSKRIEGGESIWR